MRLAFAAICALTVTIYWPAMHSPFLYDDLHVLIQPDVTFHAPISLHDERALTDLTFRLNYKFSKQRPFPYHLVNLLIHLFNGWLVWKLMQVWFTEEWAVFGAGLFLLHPLQSESVIYITARAELLAMACILGSILAIERKYWILGGAVGFLGMMAKPNALVIPVLWLLWSLARGRISRKTVPWLSAGIIGTAALPEFHRAVQTSLQFGSGFRTQCYAVVALLSRAILPIQFSIDHDFSHVSPVLVSGAIGLILVGAVVGAMYARTPWGLGLLWILVLLIPHILAEPEGYLSEHHFYSPFFGIALLLTLLLRKISEWYSGSQAVPVNEPYYDPLS